MQIEQDAYATDIEMTSQELIVVLAAAAKQWNRDLDNFAAAGMGADSESYQGRMKRIADAENMLSALRGYRGKGQVSISVTL